MLKKATCAVILTMCGSSAFAQLSTQAAHQQLSYSGKQKVQVGHIDLNALLNNTSNDLIVEYNIATAKNPTAQAREQIANAKAKIQARLNQSRNLLRDYNGLPFSFHRISNRSDLVKLLNDPEVKAVYPNRTMTLNAKETLNFIGQPEAVRSGFTGQGTTVAVLDTGVNYRHADFGSCSAPGAANCKVSHSIDIAASDNSLDDNGHGSNVSGISSAVAPGAKIVSLDVFTYNFFARKHSASDNDLISAVNWVINNAKTLNIKSANLSLGYGNRHNTACSGALGTPFQNLRNAGVIPVVASGNESYTNGISYPACLSGAVAVGAVHDANIGRYQTSTCTDATTAADKVTCFSNSGSLLTLLAPGVNVTAGGYTQSGTSQAAPHVAGAIAVLRADNTFAQETITQTIDRLINTGKKATDHRNGLTTPRLDLAAALNGASSVPPVVTPPVVTPPVVTPPVVTPPVVTPPPSKRTCTNYIFFTICSG